MTEKDDYLELLPERFFKIPKAFGISGILKVMKPSDVKVYLVLASFAHYKTGTCFPNIKTIEELSGVNKNQISPATRRLVELGLIKKKRSPKSFKFKNVYQVLRMPEINENIHTANTDKRRPKNRRKDGRWGVNTANTELDIHTVNTESIFHTANTDKKEIERDLKRVSFKKGEIIHISQKTKEEVEKVKGKDYVQRCLDSGLYVIDDEPAKE